MTEPDRFISKETWDRGQERIQIEDKAREFTALVDALRGLSDRQIHLLKLHFHNIWQPDGERDEALEETLLDALMAARALDRAERTNK